MKSGPDPCSTLLRVLIVGDEPNARDLLAGYLIDEGFHVQTATNAEEALRLARKLRPSLIMLELLLRNGSGFSILYDLRSCPETAEIPVLVLSTVNQRKMDMAIGASDYLLKPIQRGDLLVTAKRLIAVGQHSVANDSDVRT